MIYYLVFLIQIINVYGSSMEPCLSSQSVNLTNIDPNINLPIDCQCNNNDIVCIDLKVYDTDNYQIKLPNLSILFKKDESFIGYILPKQRFSFFGYRNLVPKAFEQVKFVNDDNFNTFNDQKIFIDFIESTYFPYGSFFSFGNLAQYSFNKWPKLFISIVVNENNSLKLEPYSISNVSISILSFEYAKSDSLFNVYSLYDSRIENLIIKNSNGFTGFSLLDYRNITTGIEVKNLAIEKCVNFVLNDQTLPAFDKLESITISNSNLKQIMDKPFKRFKNLKYLNLKGNLISEIKSNAFNGIEKIISLDLSKNPILYFDWNIFDSLNYLNVLDLSYTNITSIDSFDKKWPHSTSLESIALNGYFFSNDSICSFDFQKTIDLSNVLIELDPFHECNCFVFYVYKNYRLNLKNNASDWLLGNRTPLCYRNLYSSDSIDSFADIIKKEDSCNLNEIKCSKTTKATTTISISTTINIISLNTTVIKSTKIPITKPSSSNRPILSSVLGSDSPTKLSESSIIVIVTLAVISFVLIISVICLITYFFRKPLPISKTSSGLIDEYYRV
jgi:hypothetical protein